MHAPPFDAFVGYNSVSFVHASKVYFLKRVPNIRAAFVLMSKLASAPITSSAPAGVAPGATRSHWRMACVNGPRALTTLSVAAEHTLRIPPSALNPNSWGNQPHVVQSAELDIETLSQELDSSQRQSQENAKGLSPESVPGDSKLTLSGEQKAVMHLVLNDRKNIFFTGAAGTGKSVLLRSIIKELRRKYGYRAIGVTALTGIAACNIGGQTLHRFSGVGLGKEPVEELVKKVRKSQARMRWQNTEVLLIDEISMLNSDLFEKLEAIARHIRGNDIPFGGIQVIATGDLFQLPPVEKFSSSGQSFCFESPRWDRTIDKTVNLTRVFRQSDPEFVEMLNELRLGVVTESCDRLFNRLSRVPKLPKGIVPTQLFSTRVEVNNANQSALKRLVGTEYIYDCLDWRSDKPAAQHINISRDVLAEDRVNLKIGAQVMLIKNIDNDLVNGSIGRVVAFMTHQARYADYGAAGDAESHFRSRKVANADPMHVSDEERIAELLGAHGNSASAARKRKFAEDLTAKEAEKSTVLPVVKFVTPQNTVRFMMVYPETWQSTDFEGNPLASRTQLPLILAWALSIHKAQGQTLPYVSVDLKNIFEKGQAYVALSRATSLSGLQVLNFSKQKVRASPKIVTYYAQLEKIDDKDIAAAEAFDKVEAESIGRKRAAKARKIIKNDPDFEDTTAGLDSSQPAQPEPAPAPVPKAHWNDGSELFFLEPDNKVIVHSSDSLISAKPIYHTKRTRFMVESSSPMN